MTGEDGPVGESRDWRPFGAIPAPFFRSAEMAREPKRSNDMRIKIGLAEMLKGGVIMDVTNADQAKIAEDAGAVAVMALERIPADIRSEGGVARMSPVEMIEQIMR